MKTEGGKLRLDKLLVEQGYAASRERAQALILAGRVLVAEQRVDKAGTAVAADAAIRLLGDDLRYVSRGGLKLERALDYWKIDVTGWHCLDIGTSTGGFIDCMVQRGASSVLGVDTGYGQIAERLRTDPRVRMMERTNARLLEPESLVVSAALSVEVSDVASAATLLTPVFRTPTFFSMDVSFISATLVLPAVLAALAPVGERWQGSGVVLIKPQFEAGREHVGKGGIVRDPAARRFAIERVEACVRSLGGVGLDRIDSPIRGMEGNHEYLLYARFGEVGLNSSL